ncbi:hypothetical protein QUB70_28625 [Microcoleus sp. A003_D6]|uniref:hypothetical protein n=1 Tax=Microcoleus sp. A003_D6 TaxID=3055266 RepID=UPI002FD0D677
MRAKVPIELDRTFVLTTGSIAPSLPCKCGEKPGFSPKFVEQPEISLETKFLAAWVGKY